MGRDDSHDDNEFHLAIPDVEPLKQDRAEPYRRKRRPEPLRLPELDEGVSEPGDLSIETPEFLEFRRPGIQHRLFHELQRGLIEPEAHLDLHGMRVEDARRAFIRFLGQGLATGKRCVRVVHGKGRRSQEGAPILKHKTNQWLQQREEVLAFCSAPRWDGGNGAVYVLLSRKHRIAGR